LFKKKLLDKMKANPYIYTWFPPIPPEFSHYHPKHFLTPKEFLPETKDSEHNETENKETEEKIDLASKDNMELAGKRVQQMYREIISQRTRTRKHTKITRNSNNNNVEQSEDVWHCDECNDWFPSSLQPEEHLRSVVHLLSTSPPAIKSYSIGESNVGYQLLKKLDWNEAEGLGRDNQGKLDPVKTRLKDDKKGLGAPTQNKWRVTHFNSGEIPKIKRHLLKPRKKTKAERQKEFKKEKMEEESIRRTMCT